MGVDQTAGNMFNMATCSTWQHHVPQCDQCAVVCVVYIQYKLSLPVLTRPLATWQHVQRGNWQHIVPLGDQCAVVCVVYIQYKLSLPVLTRPLANLSL